MNAGGREDRLCRLEHSGSAITPDAGCIATIGQRVRCSLTRSSEGRKIAEMSRTIHVLLLIGCLLACPFKCLGGLRPDRASSEQPMSYSCCSSPCDASSHWPAESRPTQQKQTPAAPEGGCQCNGCVCEGAVRIDDDHDPIRDVFVAGWWLVDFLPPSAACEGVMAWAGDGPSWADSAAGRSLRLVIESLQI